MGTTLAGVSNAIWAQLLSGESSSSNASSGGGVVDLRQHHFPVPTPDAFRQCGGSPASQLPHYWDLAREMDFPPHHHYMMAHPPPTNPGLLMAANNDPGSHHLSNVHWSTAGELEPLHSHLLQQQHHLHHHQLCSDYQKPFIVPSAPLNLVPVHQQQHQQHQQHQQQQQQASTPKDGRERLRETSSKRSAAMTLGTSEERSSSDTHKKPRVDQTSGSCAPFKAQVRKEKLGERITALQQLVSPFGKTDTASVLLEAIGYIKFLQEQVQVLSTPYMKPTVSMNHDASGWPSSTSKPQGSDDTLDLRSRGLCLVPVSCTQHVANDNGADFWTPAIGGGCR